jgi:L-asparagine transporter-like permease
MKFSASIHFNYGVITAVVAGLILLFNAFLPQVIHESICSIFGFVVVLSYLLGVVTQWLYLKSPENLLSLKLLGMVIRILSSLGFIGILAVLDLENIILFIANFFIIFLFYLIFDIYIFISNLRPISK